MSLLREPRGQARACPWNAWDYLAAAAPPLPPLRIEPTFPRAEEKKNSSAKTEMSANKRVAIIFYSTYGHTLQMAKVPWGWQRS